MSVGEHAMCNGQVIAAVDAVVPVTLREVQYSFSVYEALRVIRHHAVHLDDHLRRLENSCRGIRLEHPFSYEDIGTWVRTFITTDNLESATLRILLIGGGDKSLCFITASPLLTYPDSCYEKGVTVRTYVGERFLPQVKTSNLLMSYLALREAQDSQAFEAVFINRDGQVLEGSRSNFFAFRNGVLYTAPASLVLEGITRDRVLAAASRLGIPVSFEPPLITELMDGLYDEAFISSTSMGAMPVSAMDGRSFSGTYDRTSSICRLIRQWELED
ncbi:aminotransferase class IV [Parasphaerochaeta coccoides]|uniref:branched-chain-amino-acid transaminase n=1 Tax=Parasphaerochaeta coccoides (strain ATCC BAA-1237 / DSM 17374 / SPN1) TaxID=760011 RepID=F4GM62_PARC1|nr:aminotransferase class IV [Parasphaerochaeta coccoides]AEC02537.1 aminotransferase class IV [Parasphaerochaeta coccoides DSM 17374]